MDAEAWLPPWVFDLGLVMQMTSYACGEVPLQTWKLFTYLTNSILQFPLQQKQVGKKYRSQIYTYHTHITRRPDNNVYSNQLLTIYTVTNQCFSLTFDMMFCTFQIEVLFMFIKIRGRICRSTWNNFDGQKVGRRLFSDAQKVEYLEFQLS